MHHTLESFRNNGLPRVDPKGETEETKKSKQVRELLSIKEMFQQGMRIRE
jgi:hypothetical protein